MTLDGIVACLQARDISRTSDGFLCAPRTHEALVSRGLVAEYFEGGTEFKAGAEPVLVRVKPKAAHWETDSNFAKSKLSENFTVRRTDAIRIDKSGAFTVFTSSGDGKCGRGGIYVNSAWARWPGANGWEAAQHNRR